MNCEKRFFKCFKMQMVINLAPVSLSNKKVNFYTCPRLTFLKKNATENAYKSISEPLDFKIFWRDMPPDPPSGSCLRRSKLASSCTERNSSVLCNCLYCCLSALQSKHCLKRKQKSCKIHFKKSGQALESNLKGYCWTPAK